VGGCVVPETMLERKGVRRGTSADRGLPSV